MRMYSRNGLSFSKRAAYLFGVTLLIAGLLAGCGGRGGAKLKAPANAGTAQELAGTSWTEPESGTMYDFVDDANVDVRFSAMAETVYGTFTVVDGMIDLSIGFRTQNGTWDGTALIIEGKPLTRD